MPQKNCWNGGLACGEKKEKKKQGCFVTHDGCGAPDMWTKVLPAEGGRLGDDICLLEKFNKQGKI